MVVEESQAQSIRLFYSYAHNDEPFLDKLRTHLSLLRQQQLIDEWYGRNINAGDDWEGQMQVHLTHAHIILLLISPDFINSGYCYSIEMMRALERHESGYARVIPVLLRPVDWQTAPFARLQILPKNGYPITTWRNPDLAYQEIALEIRAVVTQRRNGISGRVDLQTKGNISKAFADNGRYQQMEIPTQERGEIFTISIAILNRLDALQRYHKAGSELKKVHNMLHEIENSLVGLTTTLQMLVSNNKEKGNWQRWPFTRRDIDQSFYTVTIIQALWREVQAKIEELKYFAAKEMVALNEPAFVFDSTGVSGPPWIIDLLELQQLFEASISERNVNEMYNLSARLLEICRVHLRRIDKGLLKTLREADALSEEMLRNM